MRHAPVPASMAATISLVMRVWISARASAISGSPRRAGAGLSRSLRSRHENPGLPFPPPVPKAAAAAQRSGPIPASTASNRTRSCRSKRRYGPDSHFSRSITRANGARFALREHRCPCIGEAPLRRLSRRCPGSKGCRDASDDSNGSAGLDGAPENPAPHTTPYSLMCPVTGFAIFKRSFAPAFSRFTPKRRAASVNGSAASMHPLMAADNSGKAMSSMDRTSALEFG